MGEKKRKRAAEEADAAARPKKNRITESTPEIISTPEAPAQRTKKSSLSRQEKSERRSKKAKKAAEKVEGKEKDGEKRRKSGELPTPPAEDALVNGSDFVPLDDAATTPKPSKKPKKDKKDKKASKTSEMEDDAGAEIDA